MGICKDCQHYVQRRRIELFPADQVIAPGVLKEQGTWEQEERQRAQQEYQAFLAHQPFTYEPHHYAWCAAYSRVAEVKKAQVAAAGGDPAALDLLVAQGAAIVNPVTGDVSPLYELCVWRNATGECERYAAKERI